MKLVILVMLAAALLSQNAHAQGENPPPPTSVVGQWVNPENTRWSNDFQIGSIDLNGKTAIASLGRGGDSCGFNNATGELKMWDGATLVVEVRHRNCRVPVTYRLTREGDAWSGTINNDVRTVSATGRSLTSAQTPWPNFMPNLDAGLSTSPVAAVIPAGVTVVPPTPDVSPDKARWSGKWSGWACRNQVCDTKLVVEKVTAEGATIIYAFASARQNPFNERLEATFVGDELRATFRNGVSLTYRMRKEGNIEFLWRSENELVVGILSKAN